MKYLSLLLLLLLPAATMAQSQAVPDAVTADPTHHRVVLENEHVRVFEFRASPGATSPMHRHPPTLVIGAGEARFLELGPEGERRISDSRPGGIFWIDGTAHSWEVAAGFGHSFWIEVKAAVDGPPRGVAPLPATDSANRDPHVHNVIFENDHVRVFKAHAMPGTTSPDHTHPPMVMIAMGTARFEIRAPGGEPAIFDMTPGQVSWIPGTRHSWRLISGELRAYGVEIKAAREVP